MPTGTLYIVATPIGNLSDVTERALETLRSVDFVLCEDTRVTKKLLSHFGIATKAVTYHQHSDASKINQYTDMLAKGLSLALVSDAGTPGIADPGGLLIEAVLAAIPQCAIVPIPGTSAIMSALSISSFAADSFVFMGFPPHKKGRETFFTSLTNETRMVVFYESVHRITKALELLLKLCPERKLVVCRELTKKFESVYRGTASEVLRALGADTVKGEFVVVVDRM